jgi:CubicO group peptidase (beta-lactamase class C family)
MKSSRKAVALVALGLAAASPLVRRTVHAQQAVAADDARTTAASAYVVPAGWSAQVEANRVVLRPAETDLRLVLVEVGPSADARAAATVAWQGYRADMKRSIRLVTARPPRNGWEETAVVDYETSPNEHLAVSAIARRKGANWSVLLLDGNVATLEKRGGAIGQITQSWRPNGYVRETFAGKAARPLDPARVAVLVDFVRSGAASLEVPGVGLALYSNGKIVYEGGVGVRELGKPQRIDAHTRFMIASNTKSMATLLLAKLVSQGRLRWDQPVVEVYPQFRLGNDETTKATQIRHLVCACTGLPRKDMEWLFTTTERTPASDTFRQLAATQPTSKFGEAFQYNNLMASAAGYVAAHLFYPDMELGAAFDRAVKEHITDPLEMKDTTLAMAAALEANHASPHGDDADGKLVVIGQELNRQIAPFRPAGGAWSSPHDMIVYIATELNEGRMPSGQQLLAKDALLARRAHNVPIGEDRWYGMGLMDDRSLAVSVISHGGDLAGYHSNMFAIPAAGVAAVILTNSDRGGLLRGPFLRRLMEVLYDGRPEAENDLETAVKNYSAARKEARAKLQIPGDTSVLGGLAARYRNADLGTLDIKRDGRGSVLRSNTFTTSIATKKNEDGTYSVIASDPPIVGAEWVVGTAGGKRTLTLRAGQHVYVFTEVPA